MTDLPATKPLPQPAICNSSMERPFAFTEGGPMFGEATSSERDTSPAEEC
jgi:hypothetical protein